MPRTDLILLQDMQSCSRMKTKPKKGARVLSSGRNKFAVLYLAVQLELGTTRDEEIALSLNFTIPGDR